MSAAPRISVIMPVFNQERYVASAIESVISQSYGDFELVIVDDGSTDGTLDILRSVRDPRVRVIEAEHVGFIGALKRATAAAVGTLVARMDSDDLMRPDRLSRQQQVFRDHPDTVLVGSIYGLITPNGGHLAPVERFGLRPLAPRDITLATVRFADPSAMFRRDLAIDLGYDDDWENEKPLWYKLIRHGPGYVLGEPLMWCRFRLGSHSRGQLDMGDTNFGVRERYDPVHAAELVPATRDSSQRNVALARRAAALFLQAGDRRAAVGAAMAALRADSQRSGTLAFLPRLAFGRVNDRTYTRVDEPW